MPAARTYMGFLVGVIALTYGGVQIWNIAFALRHGDVGPGLVAMGGLAVPMFLIGLLIVVRIFYMVGKSTTHHS